MTVAVRYFSKSGNTKKVAEAIANAVGAEAIDVSKPLSEKVDILFLGSAVYAAGIDPSIKKFLEENKDNIGKLYNFSTAAVIKSTIKSVKKLCDGLNIAMADEEFYCRGAFGPMHKNHPDADDLAAAAAFAKKIVK